MKQNSNSPDWPELSYGDWVSTRDTLHMWTQIVGKTRLTLCAPQNHWWHVSLYVTPSGLTTGLMPSASGPIDIEFDFYRNQLVIRKQGESPRTMSLHPRSVADFYAEYMARLRSLGIDLNLCLKPQEVEDTTPFDRDMHHASYDAEQARAFHQILLQTTQVLQEFRSGFIGKCSPVHFFWGSFDLAVTRFSGRVAQTQMADPIMREAYSHEVSSCGFWPGNARFPHSAFYAYMAPVPEGLSGDSLSAGEWNPDLGEHVLRYDEARKLESPGKALRTFCEEAYRAGSRRANWPVEQLERHSG